MKIQTIVNSIFRQNFKNPLTLGRVLYGIGMMFIGFFSIFQFKELASSAPLYLPVPELLVFGVGVLITVGGFGIFANMRVERATQLLMLVFGAFILVENLPTSDMLDLAFNVIFIGAALVIGTIARQAEEKNNAT